MSDAKISLLNEKTSVVLKAATSVFLTHGFSAATTDMIQRKASVSKATLYACFSNKEAMFAAVIEQECAKMASTIKEIQISTGDLSMTLTKIGISYLNIVLAPSGLALFRVVSAEAPRFPDLGRRFYLAGPRTVSTLVAEHIKKAMENHQIDVGLIGVDAAAMLFISLIRAEGQMECLMHPHSEPSAVQKDYWVDTAVNTFMNAYRLSSR
ncbi:TetR/AcrR family transcriptional regulator [Citrobacter amalonaticus]|uniref:TetR/AcrR family transcriptional regulator n=1 Tax=Citrobacter amalonaticus TaxID=35703 RepID=UPI001908B7A0|nr:TetR/AcrR family transcriptional regulator [Citrobacter amalonaticus]MBJ9863597.1 TetR/AcrR family transcriptional regulator [Citrobacter amalonaticus]